MRRAFLTCVCLIACVWPAMAQDEPTPSSPFASAISRIWLTELRAHKTFLPTVQITMTHSSSPQGCFDGRRPGGALDLLLVEVNRRSWESIHNTYL